MPLSNDSRFGVLALTEAINSITPNPTQIRDLGIFEPKYLNTTYVNVEQRDGQWHLVASQTRGLSGQAVSEKARSVRTFNIPHLPIHDTVRADDVQNVRAFGSTQAQTVEAMVKDKLADGKLELEYTREHLMLGALQGKILDADGTVMYDLYKEFGLTRQEYTWALSNAKTEVGAQIDAALTAQRQLLRGAMPTGWVALCGATFLEKLKYHASIKPLYERYRDGAAYRETQALNPIVFEHNGIQFIQYVGDFGEHGAKIADNEAILLPLGRGLYREYFAPADMNETVNTTAQAYYASREKLPHGKGWDIHMQSNPLPMMLRPQLVATLKTS